MRRQPKAYQSGRGGLGGRRGFSLIELLVVIALVALLVGILLPALGRAKESAAGTVCMNAMRQVTFAALMYTDDAEGVLPSSGATAFAATGPGAGPPVVSTFDHGAWLFALEPYLSSELRAFSRCPSDLSPHFERPLPGTSHLRQVSYGANFFVSGRLTGYERFGRLANVPRPAMTSWLAELAETGDHATSDHIHAELWPTDPANKPRQQIADARHNGSANWSFLDGHARSSRVGELWRLDASSTRFRLVYSVNRFDPALSR